MKDSSHFIGNVLLFKVQSIEIGYKVFFSHTWKNKLVGNGKMLISIIFISRKITEYVFIEWGWTARIAIARHAFARHFWQQINCSTQILSFARIQLILAKPDSSKWQKKWQLLDSVEQLSFFLRQFFFHIEMVNNFICCTC